MTIAPGVRLGPYEIVAPLGAGGMGEVYRARDTRLDRAVAVKVLPPQLASDPQLRERFDREARAISSLNHPHICALFDVGREPSADGVAVDYLVMELLDGQTLAERLTTGPLPIADALRSAMEIADALDRAHRSGIVHRDLKPANVMLTTSGAKILDFGLAKSAAPAVATSGLSMQPTTPPGLTVQGTILGTFQYMAPEQIEGEEADARTDIFAFGAVVYEMVTGKPAFEGKTRASLLGAILKDEPPPLSRVQPISPKALDRVVARCLAKNPDERWQSVRDVLHELKWIASGAADSVDTTAPRPARGNRLAWGVAGVLALALIAAVVAAVRSPRAPAAPVAVQFTIPAPENSTFGSPPGGGTGIASQVSVSPDGRHVVFVGSRQDKFVLWHRPVDGVAATMISGTDNAAFPFWSPDSRFIGFFAGGKLRKIPIAGGPPIVLCDAPSGRGGSWNRDNVIVFAPAAVGPLQRVPASGGAAVPVTTLDATYGETNHRFPHFLPDGRHLLFTAVTGPAGSAPKPSLIRVMAIESPDTTTLFATESSVEYGSGHLIFQRDGTLMAQPFDAQSRQFAGDAFPIAEQVSTEGSRYASFAVSPTGVLVYGHGSSRLGVRPTWYDRTGKAQGAVGDLALYNSITLSPDDRRAAVTITSGTPPNRDIWILDLARSVASRLTFDPTDESFPVWSPDGSRIAFSALRSGGGLAVKSASGNAHEEVLLKVNSTSVAFPVDWSRVGLAYVLVQPGNADLWVLPESADRRPFAFLESRFVEDSAAFSPDGRWIAYSSNESGQGQIYVQPFPSTGGKYLISQNGGTQPVWRRDGRELFFLALDGTMMAVRINTSGGFEAGIPEALFPSGSVNIVGRHQYAVTRDGQRFLVLSVPARSVITPLNIVVNWPAAIQK